MPLDELLNSFDPNLRGPLKRQILNFALAHRNIKKGPAGGGSLDFELTKVRAAEAAASLKSAPYRLDNNTLAQIIINPNAWIDEIYDSL